MNIDLTNQYHPSLVEFKEIKKLATRDHVGGSQKQIKKKRASTILINNSRQFRKESLNIDVSLQNQQIVPSLPNTFTEQSIKGNNLNTMNFTQTILIQPENASQFHHKMFGLLDEEKDGVDGNYQRRGRSQSMKQFNTMISNDSDEYFKEDKDTSMKNSTSREEQDINDIFEHIKNNGAIPEQPPEQEISPLKKRKSSKKKIEKQKEESITVTDKELKDPPRDLIFRWSQFVEVLIYHVIYYMFGSGIGLIILKLILRGNNIRMIRNLGFYGCKSLQIWEMIFSNLFFFMNLFSAYYINQLSKVYLVEVFLLLIVLLQRALIVSVKYGFMLPQKFKYYKTRILTKEQLSGEFLLGEWSRESDAIIDKELNLAMSRLEIEKSSFYLCFIVNPSEEKMKELQNPNAQTFGEGELDFKSSAYGPNLMKRLIYHFNQNNGITFLKQAIFLVAKLYTPEYQEECISNCIFEYFILSANTFCDFYLTQTFIMFTAISQRHLKRVIFIMNQLSHMISAKKVEEYEEKKLYPTLNLTSDLSIRSWFHLRNLAMDFGQKYYKRIEYIISFFFIFNFLFMAIIFLINFNVIPNPGTNVRLYFKLYSIYCSFWLFLLMLDIRMGAQINKHFKIHKLFLMKNLSIIEDICSNYFLYFNEETECENFMYRELVKYFQQTHKNVDLNDMANVVHYLRPILNSLEGGIEQIEFYEKYKPFKMAGVPVSNNLLAKLILFILSLCGSVLASIYITM